MRPKSFPPSDSSPALRLPHSPPVVRPLTDIDITTNFSHPFDWHEASSPFLIPDFSFHVDLARHNNAMADQASHDFLGYKRRTFRPTSSIYSMHDNTGPDVMTTIQDTSQTFITPASPTGSIFNTSNPLSASRFLGRAITTSPSQDAAQRITALPSFHGTKDTQNQFSIPTNFPDETEKQQESIPSKRNSFSLSRFRKLSLDAVLNRTNKKDKKKEEIRKKHHSAPLPVSVPVPVPASPGLLEPPTLLPASPSTVASKKIKAKTWSTKKLQKALKKKQCEKLVLEVERLNAVVKRLEEENEVLRSKCREYKSEWYECNDRLLEEQYKTWEGEWKRELGENEGGVKMEGEEKKGVRESWVADWLAGDEEKSEAEAAFRVGIREL